MNSVEHVTQTITAGLKKRHAVERRFRLYGKIALGFAALMLAYLLFSIAAPGIGGFTRYELELAIDTSSIAEVLEHDPDAIDFYRFTQAALRRSVTDKRDAKHERHQLYALIGFFAAHDVKDTILTQPKAWGQVINVRIPLSDIADMSIKGKIDREKDASLRPITDLQLGWLDAWESKGLIHRAFNRDFFTHGDSRAPEAAGFAGSIVGSLLTLLICMALALPVALLSAIFLEEFARKNRLAEALEIVINNLAAVPSIIYGLLGLSVYLQLFGLPRSSPLVGGLTLALLILPVLIIAARASIRAVPPSMRDAAHALGASPIQVVTHHVLPYALPGILTGTILSVARAIGETAPLLMIGMVAFVADVPRGFTDPSTTMPVQIYLWASSPELGFVEKTSAGIIVLLVILLILNWAAITLRHRNQLHWS